MNLNYGTDVFTSNGIKVGEVKELVIDPRYRVVTHIVVQEGLLFNHDRLISVEYLTSADADGVRLSIDAKTVDSLSQAYSPQDYLTLNDTELQQRHGTGGTVWVRPEGASITEAPYNSVVPPGIGPIPPEPEITIPFEEIMLEKSAPVRDPNGELLGRIDECLTDADDKITHFIIAEGDVFTENKRIPIDWVREIRDNEVIIGIDKQALENL
jgi:sporulation protein YlmC with PRC-barrel domain